jgi:hypothetical protein
MKSFAAWAAAATSSLLLFVAYNKTNPGRGLVLMAPAGAGRPASQVPVAAGLTSVRSVSESS